MSLVLNVEILGEYKNLAKATQDAQSTIGKLGTKFADVGKSIAKVAAGIGLGLGAAVASQIKPAIDAASDLAESTNAVNVAFGDAAEGILELGEQAARGLGLSKTELFGIATQFSSFAETVAGEGGNVVAVVDEISTRGADFASVFNLEVGDALAKFQSGLAGSSEPLRAYGIDLSAATVEAHALATGIWDGEGAMTEAEKVMARYSSLIEQTDKVSGDFANTSDGVANQQRILKAEIENTRAEIGEKFLPILGDIQTFILDTLIPALQDLWAAITDPNGEAQRQMGALGDAWEDFVNVFKFGSTEVKSQDVFAWIGDSAVSVIKNLTHLATFVGEIFEGMSKIFAAGFGMGPMSIALRTSGINQVMNAMNSANVAAGQIRFADEIYRDETLGMPFMSPGNVSEVNININRASLDGQDVANALNSTLSSTGSNLRIR